MSKVLVFRIGSLGDTLVSLPSFHLLREQFPESCITLLTNSPVDGGIKAASSYQILIGSGLIDKYIEYPHGELNIRSFFGLVVAIRKVNPAFTIYLMPPRTFAQRARDALFFLVAGILRVRGLTFGGDVNLHRPMNEMGYYEAEASRLVRSIGFDEKSLSRPLFALNLQSNERDIAQKMLGNLGASHPFIAMSVGTKVLANDWGIDRWAELLQILRGLANQYSLIFLGAAVEHDRCQALLADWPGETRNLCGQLNPRQSAAILERAAIFVGHDSGPIHLASSAGIPCVGIYSARNKPGVWFPFGNEKAIFYNNVSCSGCNLNVCIEYEMKCIRSIRPVDVAARIKELLLKQPNAKISNSLSVISV